MRLHIYLCMYVFGFLGYFSGICECAFACIYLCACLCICMYVSAFGFGANLVGWVSVRLHIFLCVD